ncbi:hypothetical protein Taro_010471 [Colocasia esculenta]|uniref:AB hydrolase-1 domain-containing protein n=1 Tax=Colocasia esculenta TaxID=4460 RepID=A0A843U9M8_COLES|nr:hypothetical protein [Colocasia esculenta]
MASCFSMVAFYGYFLRRSFAAAGLRPETHEIDGGETTMHCWVPDSALGGSDDSRPTVVLLHGFGPSAVWQWRRQVGHISRGLRLVVPDLVFFGGSSSRSARRSVAFQAECVLKLLDRLGVGRFSVVGTSYGGFVAWHVAREAAPAGRVERVVIASSDPLKTEEDDAQLRQRAGVENISDLMLPRSTRTLRSLLRLSVHRSPSIMPDFVLRDVLQTFFTDNREVKMELLEGLELNKNGEISGSPLLQDVLIVWGEHDYIFPLEKAHLLKKHLGEKARLEVMKNTAHVPQIEDPNRFNEIVLNFLLGKPISSL